MDLFIFYRYEQRKRGFLAEKEPVFPWGPLERAFLKDLAVAIVHTGVKQSCMVATSGSSSDRPELPQAEDLIPTRESLLSRLKNWDDQESWRDFFDTYWRLIFNLARKAGLSDADEVIFSGLFRRGRCPRHRRATPASKR